MTAGARSDTVWSASDTTPDEIEAATARVSRDHFVEEKAALFAGGPDWNGLEQPAGPVYDWPEGSDYLVRSPFFDPVPGGTALGDLHGARVLVFTGDSTTTDHISPAGAIAEDSPAGRFLTEAGVAPAEFNSYGCRRGNHDVLVRGTFANPKFRNRLTPDSAGSSTLHLPDATPMSIYDAARAYAAEQVPVVVLGGADYGFGSSRDWAAKGPALLGVRAVLAKSFERIHRSNLIGMGIVPLQFASGEDAGTLGLTGHELISVSGLDALTPRGTVTVTAHDEDGSLQAQWQMTARVDTSGELAYVRQGGFLRAVAAALLDPRPDA